MKIAIKTKPAHPPAEEEETSIKKFPLIAVLKWPPKNGEALVRKLTSVMINGRFDTRTFALPGGGQISLSDLSSFALHHGVTLKLEKSFIYAGIK